MHSGAGAGATCFMSFPLGAEAVPPNALNESAIVPQAAMMRVVSCFMACLVAKKSCPVKADLPDVLRYQYKKKPFTEVKGFSGKLPDN